MAQHGGTAPPAPDADGALPSEPAGSWYTWWTGDALPRLDPLPDLVAEPWREDDLAIARAVGLTTAEVAARQHAGNHPYCARLDGTLVAYGWIAHLRVAIPEVRLRFTLPPGDRYVWDCATVPAWRGRGIYPRLLQAIIRAEMPPASRFWIGHSPGNHASARGILAAGFQLLLDFDLLADRSIRLIVVGEHTRAVAAARVLGLALPPA